MSKHWRPEDAAVTRAAGGRLALPHGAKAGLLLVVALSVGAAVVLYLVMGPRQVVAPGAEKHLAGTQSGKPN